MNQEKFERKLAKKYGTTKEEIKDLSISKIKELKVNEKNIRKNNSKFKLVKKPIKVIVKGATIGASVAGVVNTAFPNLVPVVGSYVTANSNINNSFKFLNLGILASKPIDIVSGYGIIGLGAGIGVLTYGTFKLIKSISSNFAVINDRHRAKKLTK